MSDELPQHLGLAPVLPAERDCSQFTGRRAAHIEETELDGGGRKLSARFTSANPDRSDAGDRDLKQREKARVITMVWGDRYIEDLLSLTLPALLAPGNLPAFTAEFESEFVIVTESRFFDRLVCEPVITHLTRYCDVRLLPIDDLLSPHYGITLTYALVRGFRDLGAAMTSTHLCFVCADFIVADGSYRKLAEAIKRGERLAVSPSYCMVLEDTVDLLRARYDASTSSLSIPPRELAALAIANRHNTVRAKTVNQRLFRIHRYDQFYWNVDDHTLLGRQLPIAVVYMRPERVIDELPGFWDYGVIAELCPNTKPCVLGDSDDFLMGELRAESTAREFLQLGWASVEEIAADLSSYTTQEHHDYGQHTLVLHSRDIPASLPAAKKKFDQFVADVYRHLSPPISHRDHPFWSASFTAFQNHNADQKAKFEEQLRRRLASRRTGAGARSWDCVLRLRQELREVRLEIAQHDWAEATQYRNSRLRELDKEFRVRQKELERELPLVPNEGISPGDPLAAQRIKIEDEIARLMAGIDRDGASTPATSPAFSSESAPRAARGVGRFVQLYHRLFGRIPRTTPWNPYHSLLRHVNAAIAAVDSDSDILIISSGGTFGSLLARDVGRRKVVITPAMAERRLYLSTAENEKKFDLCICDLAFDDLLRFRTILDAVRPDLHAGSRIVVFHSNAAGVSLGLWTYQFTQKVFPLTGESEIRFSGSLPGAIVARWFERAVRSQSLSGIKGPLILALTLSLCAPLARFAYWLEGRRRSSKLPKYCTSLTMNVELL